MSLPKGKKGKENTLSMLQVPESLGRWAKHMGFIQKDSLLSLTEEQLQNLTLVNMRPQWRHIMQHIRPKQKVEMIRKNLLLNKLKNTENCKELSMALGSIADLEKYVEINKVNTKIKEIEKEEEFLQESIKSKILNCELIKSKVQCKKEKIQETITKAEIFKINAKCIDEKIDNLIEVEDVINELKTPIFESSLQDYSKNKSNIEDCVSQVKHYTEIRRSKELTTEEMVKRYENLCDSIREQVLSIPAATNFASVVDLLSSSNYSIKIMAAQEPLEGPEDIKLLTKDFKSVEEHLIELWKSHALLNKQVVERKKQYYEKKKELERFKEELSVDLQKSLNLSDEDCDDIKSISEFLHNSSELASLQETAIGLNENINKVIDEVRSIDVQKFESDALKLKLSSINNDFCKNGDMLVKCKSSLALQNDSLKDKKSEIQESIVKTLTLHFKNKCNNPITLLQESIGKELELFTQVPLLTLTRNWNSNLHLDYKFKKKVLNSSLSKIFLQSDQRHLGYVSDLICWLGMLEKSTTPEFNSLNNNDTSISTDFNSDIKIALDEIGKTESEAKKLESIVRFWNDQPLEQYVYEFKFEGDEYAVCKNRHFQNS